MKKGTVIFRPDYEFDDGGVSDKLLVLLNSPEPPTPYFFLLTTSQQKNKQDSTGCYKDYFVLAGHTDFFKKNPTWFLFDTLTEYDAHKILQESLEKGKFHEKGVLKEETINGILNCLKKSGRLSTYEKEMLGLLR